MANEHEHIAAHSAAYFGDTRDHWWNVDFLRLMASRLRFDAVREVLDVGCGVGHWGQLLSSVLPADTRVTGLDREAIWVERATARAHHRGLQSRFSYLQGTAERLPFPDATFDLTTCQTVLIHLPDPGAAIAEMRRVTKPGGLVLAAEPNNLTSAMLLDTVTNRASIDAIVDLVRFQLTCERGKIALGEGDNSIGDRIPGLFARQGLEAIDVHVNDKASAVLPPYADEASRAIAEETRDQHARGEWNWNEAESRRFFLAGGGAEEAFAGHYARGLVARANIVRGLDDGSYAGITGGALFLVSGRVPTGSRAPSEQRA
jgi:SAM-dependent methyltransferase